jgi:hypothetical protein
MVIIFSQAFEVGISFISIYYYYFGGTFITVMFTNIFVPPSVYALWLQIIYLFYPCGFSGLTDNEITPFQFLRLNKDFQMLLNPKLLSASHQILSAW